MVGVSETSTETVHGAPVVAPPLTGPALSSQRWTDLTFLHWPVEPELVAPFFPEGARPDVVDGVTYVALVPFVMRGAGPTGHLSVPYFGDFCETNVRLYSVDDEGRHGVVFRSLEGARLATTLLARLGLGLPYTWARMRHRAGHTVDARQEHTYATRRRWPDRGPGGTVSLQVGDVVEPTELETWLTARWGLHTSLLGRTVWIPNSHPAWELHSATLTRLDDSLVAAAGIDVGGADMLRPLFSPGVRTTFGLPTRIATPAG
ncbi:YqjF family protein [Rhodococcus aerolatus]